jgi:hypothetical protein
MTPEICCFFLFAVNGHAYSVAKFLITYGGVHSHEVNIYHQVKWYFGSLPPLKTREVFFCTILRHGNDSQEGKYLCCYAVATGIV